MKHRQSMPAKSVASIAARLGIEPEAARALARRHRLMRFIVYRPKRIAALEAELARERDRTYRLHVELVRMRGLLESRS